MHAPVALYNDLCVCCIRNERLDSVYIIIQLIALTL